MSNPTQRLASLDGLRTISILLVIGEHAQYTAHFPEWFHPFRAYLPDGKLGVRIFFVISGFLITWLLLQEERTRGRIDLASFYKRRALRILPVLYLFLLVMLVSTTWVAKTFTTAEWVSGATFTLNYYTFGWTLGHLWSISVEEQFYLLWPFALILLRSGRSRAIFSIMVITFAPIFRALAYIYISDYARLVNNWFFSQADSLMFGCILAIILHNKPQIDRFLPSFLARYRYVQILSVLLIYIIYVVGFRGLSSHGTLGFFMVSLGPTLQSAAITCFIASAVLVREGLAYRLLNLGVMVWIGVLSYSIYIWQQVFLYPSSDPDGDLWWRAFPQNIAIVFLVACASYYGFEKPFLRIKNRFSDLK